MDDLEHEYSPSRWSHRMSPSEVIEAHEEFLAKESGTAQASVENEVVSYGDSDQQKIHIFGASTLPKDAPIVVYIHGGYWQEISVEQSSFAVVPLVDAGAVFVAIGYDLAPKVSMTEIVSQVKNGMAYVLHMAKRRQSRGVYVVGHSAGGHLAAMMLAVDWLNQNMVSSSIIKGAMLVSGIYDVRPLVNTYVNKPIQMTDEEAWENSPSKHRDSIIAQSSGRQIIIVTAQHDSSQFHKQAVQFHQDLLAGGLGSVTLMDVPNTDHFDVVEKLRDKDFVLTKELLRMVMSA